MDITTVVKTSVLAISLVLLTACSGSNEVFEEADTASIVGAGSMNEMASTGDDSVSDNAASIGERANYFVNNCGILPISTTLPSNVVSAPVTMTVDQLVSGRVNPESTTNAEHFWSIELDRGDYHLVLDTEGADGSFSDLSIKVTDIQDSGEVDLLAGERTDYRARFHRYFSVEVARTMVVRIQGNKSAENYVLGLFKNGTAVPSPFFSQCPVINLLSRDTTEPFDLPRLESSTDYHWFRAPIIKANYLINTSASHPDGSSCQIQYEIVLVEQFGQNQRFKSIGSIDKPGPVVTDSVIEFEHRGFEPAWFRIQNNNNCDLSVEFAISKV